MQQLELKHKEEVYESKLSFFTSIAHEFCMPLSLIYGPVNQIIKTKTADKPTLRYAGLIKNNAERLNSLISDLIEFRRIETRHKMPKLSVVNVSSIVEDDIVQSFCPIATGMDVEFVYQVAPNIEWVSDKNFLVTIMGNFIYSAMKYAGKNGRVILNVSSDENLNIPKICRNQMTRLPIVAIEQMRPGVCSDSVLNDDYDGGFQAGKHLISLGHRRFGACTYGEERSNCIPRIIGFRDAIRHSGGTLSMFMMLQKKSDCGFRRMSVSSGSAIFSSRHTSILR